MVEKKMDLESLASMICDLTLLETSNLIDMLKEKLNIKDIPMLGPSVAANSGVGNEGDADNSPAKSISSLILKSFESTKKAKVIKAVREIKKSEGSEIGLKEAKELVESAPGAMICDNVSADKVEEYTKMLQEAGCEVEAK